MMTARTLANYLIALQNQADMTWENEVRLEIKKGVTLPMRDYLGTDLTPNDTKDWRYLLQAQPADGQRLTLWTADFEQRLRQHLTEEYQQANNMIDFASHATKPIEGGLIKVDGSVESMVGWIKRELGIEDITEEARAL